jgi:hypothetical protein
VRTGDTLVVLEARRSCFAVSAVQFFHEIEGLAPSHEQSQLPLPLLLDERSVLSFRDRVPGAVLSWQESCYPRRDGGISHSQTAAIFRISLCPFRYPSKGAARYVLCFVPKTSKGSYPSRLPSLFERYTPGGPSKKDPDFSSFPRCISRLKNRTDSVLRAFRAATSHRVRWWTLGASTGRISSDCLIDSSKSHPGSQRFPRHGWMETHPVTVIEPNSGRAVKRKPRPLAEPGVEMKSRTTLVSP